MLQVCYMSLLFTYSCVGTLQLFPHRLKDFSGIFRKIPWEYATWNISNIFRRSFSEIFQRSIYGIFKEYFMEYYVKELMNILNEYFMTYSSFLPETFHIQVSIEHSLNLPKIFQWKISNKYFRKSTTKPFV